MADVKNIAFIMCDQLRWDYLSCYGHPHLDTPNIDTLANDGVRFERAYVQSPICGPSRMSFYTGRYMSSHGSTWNGVPLRIGEMTIGDYMGALGWQTVLVGKTHMRADREGMERLGIDPASDIGVRVSECGFDPFERDDGIHPSEAGRAEPRYNAYLREHGFDGTNPWHDWANAGAAPEDGSLLSGWYMKNAHLPARVPAEHSETAYTTNRAMDFIRNADERPWCLHLSYIKPHWPYIAPAPYHEMYGAEDLLPVCRSDAERISPHPVYSAFMDHRDSRAFSRDEVRATVLPAYMGLIKQIDDELGRFFAFLKEQGLWDSTLIVFTSDHGDYLGDHWLGEKELFHECSVRIPMIIRDPSAEADTTRGQVNDKLIEGIDLAPTFLELAGGTAQPHRLEGRSLLSLIRPSGDEASHREHAWRDCVVSEYDYSMRGASQALGVPPSQARIHMIRDDRWKYITFEGFDPQLFDLDADPNEFHDLGCDPAYADIRARLHESLFSWSRNLKHRTTISDDVISRTSDKAHETGFLIGWWDEKG